MEEHKEEKLIDIKGTLEQFVKADEPEISQEEAIMRFGETKKKKNNNADSDDTESFSEEMEHLKRIKKELLASLERVKKLEEKLFKEHEEKIKLNIKANKATGFTSVKAKEEKKIENDKQKERE